MTLPFMYWMPKMHYSPSRARFIVASSACSSKPLSQAVSKVFKLLFHQVQNFHAKSTFYKNYNRFWVIENSSPIIERLNSLTSIKRLRISPLTILVLCILSYNILILFAYWRVLSILLKKVEEKGNMAIGNTSRFRKGTHFGVKSVVVKCVSVYQNLRF